MSPFSAPVLGGAALVSSPALWNGLVEGATTPTVALVRYLVSVLLCWMALEVVGLLVGPAAPSASAAEQAADPERAENPTPVT
jgi:hypothetical protein